METGVRILAIAALLMLVPPVASADDTQSQLAIIASLAFIDYNQSVDMFYHSSGYYEMNPLLGPNPRRRDLIAFGMVGVGVTYVLSKTLPDPWRQIVIDSIIASERFNVEENRRLAKGWSMEGPPARGREIQGIPLVLCLRF